MKYEYINFTENRTYEEAVEIYRERIKDAEWIYNKYKNEFRPRSCPCCGNSNRDSKLDLDRFHGWYGVVRCTDCNMIYVDPCPPQQALNDYYMNGKCNSLLENIYAKRAQKKKSVIVDDKVELFKEYLCKYPKDEINILELGCSSGGFLKKLKNNMKKYCADKLIRYIGVDTNKSAIESNEDGEVELYYDTAEHFLENTNLRFDFVWHTELLEHVIDPYSIFQKIKEVMVKNGYMIFTTPNDYSFEMNALDYNELRLLACNIFPPMHINCFGIHNIVHFILRSGYSLISLDTPGKLDISILELQSCNTDNEYVKYLSKLDLETKGYIQALISYVGASSNMRCIVQKK